MNKCNICKYWEYCESYCNGNGFEPSVFKSLLYMLKLKLLKLLWKE